MFSAKRMDGKTSFITADTLCLLSPLLLLPFIAWEFSLATPLRFYVAIIGANLAESILGSVGHSGLAWGLLYLTPEGRQWFNEKESQSMKTKIFFFALAVFAVTTSIFLLDDGRYTLWFFAAYVTLVLHHSIMQTQGIAFAYSYEGAPSPEERKIIERVHRQQKMGFKLLVVLACSYPLDSMLHLDIFNSMERKLIFFLVASATVAWLILTNLQIPAPQKQKMAFLARTFCVPFGIFSVFAALGIRILHSFEYILIYRKMMSHSGYSVFFKKYQVVLISLSLFLAVTIIWIFLFFTGDELRTDYEFSNGKPWWFSVLAGITVTRAITHFYLDRLIFQMKNPISRKFWGPLLIGIPATSASPDRTP